MLGPSGEFLAERTVYGESATNPEARNLRGRPLQHHDGAGVATTLLVDFKGNVLQSERQLAKAYRTTTDWSPLAMLTVPSDLTRAAGSLLESEVFSTQTAFDALNRPTSVTTPDRSELRPMYNEASLLARVDVRLRNAASWTNYVDSIHYNAKGQREQIGYGQAAGAAAITTAYAYDPLTYRLTHLKTTRTSDGAVLQNLSYTYDPVGNITEISDSAQQRVFFANDVMLPNMAYVYDALYRLVSATGREQAGGLADVQRDDNDAPLLNLPHQNDSQALRNYAESYRYDPVGNLLQMVHSTGAAAASWTRAYKVDPESNRLLATSVPGDSIGQFSATYGYDAHGNMTSMPHLPVMRWNHRDELEASSTQSVTTGGTPETTYYVYDASGQRVRKVTERYAGAGQTPTRLRERIYLGGWEIYREFDGSGASKTLERETLHVMDGEKRIALVETKTLDAAGGGASGSTSVTRFQLGNHLGSAVLEVDELGRLISYEEYHPYGTTAYHSGTGAAQVSLKRYRYNGKERDDESGLYYYGARYYAPWLGRWTAADPKGMVDGPCLYAYVRGNPIKLTDPTGTQSTADLIRQAKAASRAREQFDATRHASGRLSPDQIGDIYKTAPQPDYAGPATPEAAQAQQTQLHVGEAKREAAKAEQAKNPPPTKSERREADKRGAWNWAVDQGAQLVLLGSPTHDPVTAAALQRMAAMLKAPEPTDMPLSYRDWVLRKDYDFAQGTLTTASLAVSFVPVGGIVEGTQLAGTKLTGSLRGLLGSRAALGPGGKLIPVARDFVDASKIGMDVNAPKFYSIPNQGGGRLWVTNRTVMGREAGALINPRAAGGRIELLSGVHGDLGGELEAAPHFFQRDVNAFGKTPGVTVHDVAKMTPEELKAVVTSNARVVASWCYSERCTTLLQALGHVQ